MWHLDWELETWFDNVNANRASGESGGGASAKDPPMMENALAADFRKRAR